MGVYDTMRYAIYVCCFLFWMDGALDLLLEMDLEMEMAAGTGVGREMGKERLLSSPPDAHLWRLVIIFVSSVSLSVFLLAVLCRCAALRDLSSELVDLCVNGSQ